nr:hypothetical protein [Tanacetum cinerariifolium]
NVTTIKESKDLKSLSFDELIDNLKVHAVVKGKGKRRSLALKAKKESSDEESSNSRSEYKEYAMAKPEMTRMVKAKGSDLDVEIQIISSEKVQNHQETRTKELLLEVLGAIAVRKLVLLVYKVTNVFNKVNDAKSRVTTTVRVSTARWIKWLEDHDI